MNLVKKKNIRLILVLGLVLSFTSCDGKEASENTTSQMPTRTERPLSTETAEEILSEEDTYEQLLLQFFEDANVQDTIREQFTEAICGGAEAQKRMDDYAKPNGILNWSVKNIVFPFRNSGYPYSEAECLYNIGMFYYNGNDYIEFVQNKEKAFAWLKMSADKGSIPGALQAGDMARYRDGVQIDEQASFALYTQASDIELNGAASQRLGDCYADGIGTATNKQKAIDYYLESAMMGNALGLYKLSIFADSTDANLTTLYKAASSQNYYGNDDTKHDLINRLYTTWDNGTDPAAVKMQNTVLTNEHFAQEFIEELMKVSYTYSYHAFAEEHILQPNRTYEDAQFFAFAPYDTSEPEYGYVEGMAERYLEYENCQFYEYDFDSDEQDEIGIPIHTGVGGSFSGDGFAVFKKNEDGLYEYYASGPDYMLADSMRIIRYDNRIYFLANPLDITDNATYNISAYIIDGNGNGQGIMIDCMDYSLQHIITYTAEEYAAGYNVFLSELEKQMREAVTATRQGLVYNSAGEQKLSYKADSNLWDDLYSTNEETKDYFIAADLNNDGNDEVIHKGYSPFMWKGNFYYYWFQIYTKRDDFDNDTVTLQNPKFDDEYYGIHSGGNLYDLLPIGSDFRYYKTYKNVVQFWTHEYNGLTYSMTLQRHQLLYTLQIFVVQEGEARLVSKSLFFDEVQSVEISFS